MAETVSSRLTANSGRRRIAVDGGATSNELLRAGVWQRCPRRPLQARPLWARRVPCLGDTTRLPELRTNSRRRARAAHRRPRVALTSASRTSRRLRNAGATRSRRTRRAHGTSGCGRIRRRRRHGSGDARTRLRRLQHRNEMRDRSVDVGGRVLGLSRFQVVDQPVDVDAHQRLPLVVGPPGEHTREPPPAS